MLNGRRTTTGNTGLTKVAVQCSADTYVVKITNFAKPEKRYGQAFLNSSYFKNISNGQTRINRPTTKNY
jgi:hypothetical protein